MADSPAFRSLGDLLRWLKRAPASTSFRADALATLLESLPAAGPEVELRAESPSLAWTWRERVWTVPAETRLGTAELAEALGRPKSWIYERTSRPKTVEDRHNRETEGPPLPFRKLDGTLVFVAGEVREWIREREDIMQPPPGPGPGTIRIAS